MLGRDIYIWRERGSNVIRHRCFLFSGSWHSCYLFQLFQQNCLQPAPCYWFIHGLHLLPLVQTSFHSRGVQLSNSSCVWLAPRAWAPCGGSPVFRWWSHECDCLCYCPHCHGNWITSRPRSLQYHHSCYHRVTCARKANSPWLLNDRTSTTRERVVVSFRLFSVGKFCVLKTLKLTPSSI